MNIGLDARYLSHGLLGGVRNYVFQLAQRLPRLAPHHQFFYYVDNKAPLEIDAFPDNVLVRTMSWRSPLSSVWNDMVIARLMSQDRVHAAHFPANSGPAGRYRLIVTLHDSLNLLSMRDHLRGVGTSPSKVGMMAYLRHQARMAVRNACQVITLSEHAKADIAARTGLPADRIRAIHLGCDERFHEVSQLDDLLEVRRRLALPAEFLLADGIKNPGALLAAYDGLSSELRHRIGIVFFTRELAPRPEVAARADGKAIQVVIRPSLPDLVALMNLAIAFVFPSWYEGFGLPLVEAMRCGTPVVASSRGSIPEVLGGAGLLFDVDSPDELRLRLLQVLGDESLRNRMREESLARGRVFSWDSTARRVLDVYDAVLAGPASSS